MRWVLSISLGLGAALAVMSCSNHRSPRSRLSQRDVKVEVIGSGPASEGGVDFELMTTNYLAAYDKAELAQWTVPITLRVFVAGKFEPDILPANSLVPGAIGATNNVLIAGRRLIDVIASRNYQFDVKTGVITYLPATLDPLLHELLHAAALESDPYGGYIPAPGNVSAYIHDPNIKWSKAKAASTEVGKEITGDPAYIARGLDYFENAELELGVAFIPCIHGLR